MSTYRNRGSSNRVPATDNKDRRRAEMFAAKWRADEHTEEPTDDALREAFSGCVRPPKSELYPLIRETIYRYRYV